MISSVCCIDGDGMKKVCSTKARTSTATRIATPSRMGSSRQKLLRGFEVCSSITSEAYVVPKAASVPYAVFYSK